MPGEPPANRDDFNSNSADEHHAMFLGMFHTAIEMIEEEGSQKESTMADDSKGRVDLHTTKPSCPRIDSGGNRRSSSSSRSGGGSSGSKGKDFIERRKRR